jgi:hypothetical protein
MVETVSHSDFCGHHFSEKKAECLMVEPMAAHCAA